MIAVREPDRSVLAIVPDVATATLIRACLIECGHDCWIDLYPTGEPHEILGEVSAGRRDTKVRRQSAEVAA